MEVNHSVGRLRTLHMIIGSRIRHYKALQYKNDISISCNREGLMSSALPKCETMQESKKSRV